MKGTGAPGAGSLSLYQMAGFNRQNCRGDYFFAFQSGSVSVEDAVARSSW